MSAVASANGGNGLHFLSDEERNFLLLYRGGGVKSVMVEMGLKRVEVEPRFAAIKAKIEREVESRAAVDQDADADEKPTRWPHTNGVARRLVPTSVSDTHAEVGPAFGPVLGKQGNGDDGSEELTTEQKRAVATAKRKTRRDAADRKRAAAAAEIPEGFEPEDEPVKINRDPNQSPILDYLTANGKGSAPQIAEFLNRKTSNVSTRLRQLEQRGYVRRTGRTVPGGRGGPQIEYELSHEDKAPTSPDDVLDAPLSAPTLDDEQRAMRRAYFEHLLSLVTADSPDSLHDRIERLIGARP